MKSKQPFTSPRRPGIKLRESEKVFTEAYEKESEKLSGRMKSFEKSRDQIREQIEELENLENTIEDADATVGEIQAGLGDLEALTFEEKRAIVGKIYPPSSILFFPRWYLKLGPESDETLTCFSLTRRRIEQSTIHLDLDLAPAGA